MRIKNWTLTVVWEDGTTDDVSCEICESIARDIENFCEFWEEAHNEYGGCAICGEEGECEHEL
jgi:hypothetical protein